MVTLAELKDHLRIEQDEEDHHLHILLASAKAAAEDFCRVTFDDTEPIPEPVRLAVLLHAGHFYTHRENGQLTSYQSMTRAFHALLWPYRNPDKLV